MNPIQEYLRKIEKDMTAGNATEHTYRPALKALIESLATDTSATNSWPGSTASSTPTAAGL